MKTMKRVTFILWAALLLYLGFPSFLEDADVKGDIAPVRLEGSGAYALFIDQPNLTMVSFSVDVVVNLPGVYEEYVYVLRNDRNDTIRQMVIIPTIFELSEYYYEYNTAEADIYVNSQKVRHYFTSEVYFTDPDLLTDMDHYIGYVVDLTFEPFQTLTLKAVITSTHDDYTREFRYFYSAKTARYWNGSIENGNFRFEFVGEYKEMTWDVPNAMVSGNVISSEMNDWDGDAVYTVSVKFERHNDPTPIIIMMIYGSGCFLLTVGVIGMIIYSIYTSKKMKNMQK